MWKLLVGLAVLGVAFGVPKRSINGRIIGGNDTTISEHPYQLALLSLDTYFCGGALITYQWGLTAAHCFDYGIPFVLRVRGGSTLRSSGGQVIDVDEVLRHPNYNVDTVDYDAAIMRFAAPFVIFNTEPAVLPEVNHIIFTDDEAIVTGWGALEDGGAYVEVLQEVHVPVVSTPLCRNIYGTETITEAMFCAGYLDEEAGRDSCQGDAGGPVIIDGILVGLVSWGRGCADPKYPAVYTRVPVISGWIREILDRS